MEWLSGLLNIGSGILGTLIGDKENVNQNTNSTTAGTTAATSNIKGTTQENTTQNQTNTGSVKGVQSTTDNQAVNRLDSKTLALLTQQVQGAIGGFNKNQTALDAAVKTQAGQKFDVDKFVKGVVGSAKATATADQNANLGAIADATGAGADTNSAAALLSTRVKNDTAANLAGVEQNARATGAQIAGVNADTLTKLTDSSSGNIQQMLGSLLQARETSTGQQQTNTSQTSVDKLLSNLVSNVKTNQTQNTAGTTAETTVGNVKSDSSKHDWQDLFKGLGGIFTADF